MSNISVSKMKIFDDCKLEFKYKYVDKWSPVETKKEDVTAKGLVMHQCFENILKYENYKDEKPGAPYRVIEEKEVLNILKKAMEENEFTIQAAKDYRLKLGLQRWLDFKHNYLDKRNSTLYAEKEYKLELFGDVQTTAILDLLEDMGDGKFVIYDYKTPQKANNSNYKTQLLIYSFVQALALGLVNKLPEDPNTPYDGYKIIADRFTLYVFYPLLEGDDATYKTHLKQIKFKEEDVKIAVEKLRTADQSIKDFDFTQNAVMLQPTTPKFTCSWCEYCGSKKQEIDGKIFEGCPITAFAGCECKHTFKKG